MTRKYLTQMFPALLPIRQKQRLFCFYMGMRLDRNLYASRQLDGLLPYEVFASKCLMRNTKTGLDMIYQENKVFNLKLAAKKLDRLVIRPKETFSFCLAVKDADKQIPYKEGLTEIYGKLTVQQGGGLCMLSNLLFWAFLHTPLTIVERHGHGKKDFPEPPSDAPMGVDATVSEGWLDLKVRNDTDTAYQICISFDDEFVCGEIRADKNTDEKIEVINGPTAYYREGDQIFEEVDVIRNTFSRTHGGQLSSRTLYRNRCEIGYELPEHIKLTERTKS